MRIKPPSEGAAPSSRTVEGIGDSVSDATAVEHTTSLGSTDATASVAPTGATEGAGAVAAAGGVSTDPVAEVARRLRAGEINAKQALEQLIDDVVKRQVGKGSLDRRALAGQLKELLRRQLESDPYLASKVRRLGNPS